MKYIVLLILITGCTRDVCQISIDNLKPAEKIPKVVNINIDELFKVDLGGTTLLRNYSVMKHQIDAIIQDCR